MILLFISHIIKERRHRSHRIPVNWGIIWKTGSVIKEDGTHEVSFCGYFKVNDSVYTCLIIISNPKKGYPSGGIMAVNVIKEIINNLN